MGKKNNKEFRSVPVEITGTPASQAGGQLLASGPGKPDAGAIQSRVDELTAKLQRRDDELTEAQQRLAAMEQILQAREGSLAALQAEVDPTTGCFGAGRRNHAYPGDQPGDP